METFEKVRIETMRIIEWLAKHHHLELSVYFDQGDQWHKQHGLVKFLLEPRNLLNCLCLLYWWALFWLRPESQSTLFYLDIFGVYQLSRVPHLILASIAAKSFYYQQLVYSGNDIAVTRTIKHLLLERKSNDFLPPYKYSKNRHVLNYIERCSFLYWLLMFVFRHVSDLAVFSYFILIVQFVWFNLSSPHELSKLFHVAIKSLLLSVSIAATGYIIHHYVAIATLLSHLSMVIIRILHVQIWQSVQLLYVARHRPVQPLQRFTRINRKILLHLLEANSSYGSALLVFLLVYIPINCYLSISVASGRVVTPVNYCYSFNAFLHLFAIVGIHVVVASFNSYFLESNVKFYSCMVRSARFTPPRASLQLSLYFQAFHTQKRYGFSYSHFGRISKLSFTKSMLIYSQFLMYVYMMTRQI